LHTRDVKSEKCNFVLQVHLQRHDIVVDDVVVVDVAVVDIVVVVVVVVDIVVDDVVGYRQGLRGGIQSLADLVRSNDCDGRLDVRILRLHDVALHGVLWEATKPDP